MLIRPCHRVLKAINYLCSQDNSQTTSNLDLMIFFHQKLKDLDLFDTIQQLINDGYITATIDGSLCSDIRPTYKGRHYSEYRWIAAKEVILLPVAVAMVTTLLTLAFSGVFTSVP